MKKSIISTLTFLFLTVALHAQSQFPFKIDTAKAGKLGFNKQNRLPLPLNDSIMYPDFTIKGLAETNTYEDTSEWNIPVHEPDGNYPMPIHVPDSTINYSMKIVRPKPY